MPATATEIFRLLEDRQTFSVERHEVSLPAFGSLRRAIRSIVVSLREGADNDGRETADRLRSLLSEWLTVPVLFDGSLLAALKTFGDSTEVEARWGRDIRAAFDSALLAAHDLQQIDNPVRTKIQAVIRELRIANRTFTIYCHRTARARFDSLFVQPTDTPLPEDVFLHSVRDYREATILDSLIKVGPLRSWGWGSAPDAIKAAPRFGTLIQIVWAGCADEPGFGYDPVAPPSDAMQSTTTSETRDDSIENGIKWTSIVTRSEDFGGAEAGEYPEEDDFRIFGNLNQPGQKRRAVLLRIDGGQGILHPPHAQVLSFDPTLGTGNPVDYRLPGETLLPGMFVILPRHDAVDLGGLQARAGTYSSVWKARLSSEYQADPIGVISRLANQGIRLLHLRSSVERWTLTGAGALPAPGDQRHFQILIQVLGVGFDAGSPHEQRVTPWWQLAWNEIRHARGFAIQIGRHEQEIVDKELVSILSNLMPSIRAEAIAKNAFSLLIPTDHGLTGSFSFFKLHAVEDGFMVPETDFKIVRELNEVEQWRA